MILLFLLGVLTLVSLNILFIIILWISAYIASSKDKRRVPPKNVLAYNSSKRTIPKGTMPGRDRQNNIGFAGIDQIRSSFLCICY